MISGGDLVVTQQQKEYLLRYQSGETMQEIADYFGVNRSTVSRVISRARKIKCPFASDCTKCTVSDCAIKEEYAFLLNEAEDCRKIK